MAANQTVLEVTGKCKFTEECVMCTEKHALVQKMFTNVLNMEFPRRARVKGTVETHWLSGKEKVLGAAVSKQCFL